MPVRPRVRPDQSVLYGQRARKRTENSTLARGWRGGWRWIRSDSGTRRRDRRRPICTVLLHSPIQLALDVGFFLKLFFLARHLRFVLLLEHRILDRQRCDDIALQAGAQTLGG